MRVNYLGIETYEEYPQYYFMDGLAYNKADVTELITLLKKTIDASDHFVCVVSKKCNAARTLIWKYMAEKNKGNTLCLDIYQLKNMKAQNKVTKVFIIDDVDYEHLNLDPSKFLIRRVKNFEPQPVEMVRKIHK